MLKFHTYWWSMYRVESSSRPWLTILASTRESADTTSSRCFRQFTIFMMLEWLTVTLSQTTCSLPREALESRSQTLDLWFLSWEESASVGLKARSAHPVTWPQRCLEVTPTKEDKPMFTLWELFSSSCAWEPCQWRSPKLRTSNSSAWLEIDLTCSGNSIPLKITTDLFPRNSKILSCQCFSQTLRCATILVIV